MYYGFIPESATVNSKRYKNMLAYLWEAICLRYTKMWTTKNWAHMSDNAPTHHQQQHIKHVTMVPFHSLYIPWSHTVWSLPLSVDERPVEGLSKDAREVQVASKIALQEIMHDGCQTSIKLCEHQQKCVATEGQYFESNYMSGLLNATKF
jgi:hypothetical protein